MQVDLVGDNGITKVNSDQVLTVEVKGAGVLQGFGSATPCTIIIITMVNLKPFTEKQLQ